tara:strand:- start:79 stop:1032 length:954 start_codon:yes stop_codon:yes gene_type:complete
MESSEIEQNVIKIKDLLKSLDFNIVNTGLELLKVLDENQLYEKLLEGCRVDEKGKLVNEKKEISNYLVCVLSIISHSKTAKEIIIGIQNNHIEIKLHSTSKIKDQIDKLVNITNLHIHLQNYEDYKSLILKGSEPIFEEEFKTSKEFIAAAQSLYKKSSYTFVEINIAKSGYSCEETITGSKWDKNYEFNAVIWHDVDNYGQAPFLGNLNDLFNLLQECEISDLGEGNIVDSDYEPLVDTDLSMWSSIEEYSDVKWYSDESHSLEVQLSEEEKKEVDCYELYTEADLVEGTESYIVKGGLLKISVYFDNKFITLWNR